MTIKKSVENLLDEIFDVEAEILDIVDLGQISKTYDEKNGDYIKIELRNIKSDIVLYTFYSNRLLFEHEVGNYYFGDYHYNQTTRYFMEVCKTL